MLPPFIIQQERLKDLRREQQRRPVLQLPLPESYPDHPPDDRDKVKTPSRVIVIDLC